MIFGTALEFVKIALAFGALLMRKDISDILSNCKADVTCF